jgi:Glycosyl hydrolases family 11
MVSFTSVLVALAAVGGVVAQDSRSWWTDGTANATYTSGPNGLFEITWTGNKGDFVGGKGRNSGGAR